MDQQELKGRINRVTLSVSRHLSAGNLKADLCLHSQTFADCLPSAIMGPNVQGARDDYLNALEVCCDVLAASNPDQDWKGSFEKHLQEVYAAVPLIPKPSKPVRERPELEGQRLPIGPTVPNGGAGVGEAQHHSQEVTAENHLAPPQSLEYKALLTDEEYAAWQTDFQARREKEQAKERVFSSEEYTHLLNWIFTRSVLPTSRPKPNPRKKGGSSSKRKG